MLNVFIKSDSCFLQPTVNTTGCVCVQNVCLSLVSTAWHHGTNGMVWYTRV